MTRRGLLPFLVAAALSAESEFTVENTNFLLKQPDLLDSTDYIYDYDRLRLRADWREDGYFFTATGDALNYLGYDYVLSPDFAYLDLIRPDTPFEIRTDLQRYSSGAALARIYRLHGGYEGNAWRLDAGIQKISMGVGRIWTPTDLYNPKNSYALEPDEVYGVLAAQGAYSPTDLSTVSAVVSLRRDRTLKYAARYKGYLTLADVGIDLIKSDDTTMVGYELEGNFLDTGAEWRTEGGYFKNDPLDAEFFQGIAGFDYGFENGVTWAVEALYSSETFTYAQLIANYESEIINNMVLSPFYVGTTLSYDFNLLYSGSLLYIESFNDENSHFVVPNLSYYINDNNTLSVGAMLGLGSRGSEFEQYGQTYYLKWVASY
ncbi:MAG: hypothetical protein IE886_08390, partial [Campylobacterales bacterium]|nr:hypothetical protein [Campylobacterales bacterium]